MKTLTVEGYTINICTDINEWAKEFYEMPDDAVLDNEDEVSNECMGFADIDTKTIWVFVPKKYELSDLKSTVSHEIGHIIEMVHQKNPEQKEGNEELHEQKANHYMNFFMFADDVIRSVVNSLDI